MKNLLTILAVIGLGAALIQLLGAEQELKSTREALIWEVQSDAKLITLRNQQMRRQVEKTAELEAKLKGVDHREDPIN
jgi:hypothetical protein